MARNAISASMRRIGRNHQCSPGGVVPATTSRLSLRRPDGQNGTMPAPAATTTRRKKASDSPADSRRRRSAKPSKAAARSRLAARRLWPVAVVAAGVFLIAYLLDWDSITALMWNCLAGQFGLTVSLESFGVLFLLGCGAALLWNRPIPQPAAKAPRKPRRSPAQPKKTEPIEAPEAQTPVDARPAVAEVVEKRPRKAKVAR